jgi:hypothetical protein
MSLPKIWWPVLFLLPLHATGFFQAAGDSIRVPVWMENRGEPPDPADFIARLDGQIAPVLSVQGPADDLLILLVLDITGDMSVAEIAKQAAIEAIRGLPENAAVAVLRAQDGMRVLMDPTTDREALASLIGGLPVSGKAGFLDSVENACQVADRVVSKSKVRTAVLYLTDSSIYNHRDDYTNPVINSSDSRDLSRRFPEGLVKEKISRLETKIGALQAPLFVVHLAYRTDRLEQAYQLGQMQLALAAGGSATFCRSKAEVPGAITAVFSEVASHYSLQIRLPERPSRLVQVEIEKAGWPVRHRTRFSSPAR